MPFYEIKVDEDVWRFLKTNAEPFKDSPNSVLRRLLLGKDENDKCAVCENKTPAEADLPVFPYEIPQALAQILEVIYCVKKRGMSRHSATNQVAQKRRVAPQTIIDKYCRQLGKRAREFDHLLEPQNLDNLQFLLKNKFDGHKDFIQKFFNSLT